MPTASPVSLVNARGETASSRRARQDVKAADAAAPPALAVDVQAKLGWHTRNATHIHVLVQLPDAGTSLDWQLWIWDQSAGQWALDTRLGTAGTVSLAVANSPQRTLVEIQGAAKVWVRLLNLAGAFTSGANVWVSGSVPQS